MSSKHPLFPVAIDAKIADLNTKRKYMEENAARLGIPPQELSIIAVQVDDVNTAGVVARNKDTRSKVDVALRNQAIRTAQTTVRRVIDYYIVKNPNVTSVDYTALNIPVPARRHPLEPPTHAPGIGRIVSEDLAILIPFFNSLTGRMAKPEGAYGIEAYYKLGGDRPASIDEMSECKVVTSSPMRIQFDIENEFETLYLTFRWVGTRGDCGPWSEIYKVIISR
jgi:hypothetical protein